jgi:hypothetical protein
MNLQAKGPFYFYTPKGAVDCGEYCQAPGVVASALGLRTLKKAPAVSHRGWVFPCARRNAEAAGLLTDADVHGTPRPHARRDVASRTAIPVGQEHPFAIKEAAESEMASVLEEVSAHYAAMVEVDVFLYVAVSERNGTRLSLERPHAVVRVLAAKRAYSVSRDGNEPMHGRR